jgi:hypothetical protein
MVALPQPTIDAIYAAHKKRGESEPARGYLGGSELGQECDRRLWYSFRHVGREPFDGRMYRLFDTGHREEARIIADLRAIGCTVHDVDPATGKQWRFDACDGHLSGGLDGVVIGLPESPERPHLLECKTSNKKNFDKLEREGVEKAKPVHFAQMQLYMGLSELTRAVYVVVCKDDDSLYVERVRFEPRTFKALLMRANRIIKAESPPDRLSEDPAFWVCKFCPFASHCHGSLVPPCHCRTCVHAAPAASASWSCANSLPMAAGCGAHIYIPGLLHWAEPLDGTPEWVRYRVKSTGREFINCADEGFPGADVATYASRELVNCQVAAIGHPAVEAARTILGGEVVA